ncbi:hypothetical protein C8Q76DRAFT_789620 [Earliella scabrosa]|nr:hypothetical protein C8Q76DRAFT_789615 [Earliella scabrosa]KAI0745199.1 hypothetical protein C8Q76DRAFT_789620 [Earliella scabrosa]
MPKAIKTKADKTPVKPTYAQKAAPSSTKTPATKPVPLQEVITNAHEQPKAYAKPKESIAEKSANEMKSKFEAANG